MNLRNIFDLLTMVKKENFFVNINERYLYYLKVIFFFVIIKA